MTQRHRTKATARSALVAAGIVPRGLSLDEAAAYVNLCPKAFLAEVAKGHYPRPLSHGSRRDVWDLRALDSALDQLSGLAARTADTVTHDPRLVDEMDRAIAEAAV